MNNNLKAGDKITIGGQEQEIIAVKKNFLNDSVQYRLKDGSLVNPSKVQTTKKLTLVKENKLEQLQEEYVTLSGKKLTNLIKNDARWLAGQIDELKKANEIKAQEESKQAKIDSIIALDRDACIAFIAEKELGIDADDFDDDELTRAILQELELV